MSQDYERELASYAREPLGVTRNGGTWPEPRHRFSLAACARWEARYAVEWLAYHRSIGIDHVYLYCNDDDPRELYEAVLPFLQGPEPFVTFRHYSFQGLQYQMYFHFMRHFMHETKWFMFLDLDEFVCIRGSNSLPAFMEGYGPEVDAVYFNWCSFGANGHATRPEGPVLLNYTRRERTATPFTKVLIQSRSAPYQAFFGWTDAPVMHDYTALDRSLVARNVLGDDVAWYYDEFPSKAWPYLLHGDRSERILARAFVAHYNIKSDEDFDLRVQRGLKGDYAAERMWGEKDEAARREHHALTNAVEDTYLHDYWAAYLDRGWSHAVFPRTRWTLLSAGCPATQISTAHSRPRDEDARAVLSGKLTGRPQSHTKLEDDPWWSMDLGARCRVHEMRLFNRLDGVPDRMARFRVLGSTDHAEWVVVHEKTSGTLFGGADGSPYCWVDEAGFEARWLRIVMPGAGRYFHLDQVQFFGERLG